MIKIKLARLLSDKKFNEILTGSVWALSAKIASAVTGMLTSIFIARKYGPDAIGILEILNSFLSIVTIFTVLGTGTSILRFIPEHITRHSTLSAFLLFKKTQYIVITISVITGIVIFSLAGSISEQIFSKPHLKHYFILASIFVVFKSILLLNTQAIRAIKLIKTFAFMQFLPIALKLIIIVIFTLIFYNIGIPIYAMFFSIGLTAVIGTYIVYRRFRKKISPNDLIHQISIKEILNVSLPMLMTATMGFIISQTGVIMLGILKSETDVGYYSISVKLSTLTAFVLSSITSMAAPKFSELYHSGKLEELFYVVRKSTKLIFWSTTPILIFLIILGKPLISFLFGPQYTVAYFSMILLVIGQFVNSISGATGTFLNMTGKQNAFLNIIGIAAVLCLVLNYFLIPFYGIVGSAIASMVSMVFWNFCALIYIKHNYGIFIGYIPSFKKNNS